jgi:hypothetical protein
VHCDAGARGHGDTGTIKLLCPDEIERRPLREGRAEIAAGSPMLCCLRQLPDIVPAEFSLGQFLAVGHLDPGLDVDTRE